MSDVQKPKALVLRGLRLQSDQELVEAFQAVGFQVESYRMDDLLESKWSLDQLYPKYSVIALPAGASTDSQLGSGKETALQIQFGLKWDLSQFAQKGGLVYGEGSGFRTLLRLGLFGKDISFASLTSNAQIPLRKDLYEWVRVLPQGQVCIWLRGLGTLDLPMQNHENRVVFHPNRKTETWVKMQRKSMNCLVYDPMGAEPEMSLAGLCDASGRIFGMMPQASEFIRWTSYPEWTLTPQRANAPGQGLQIFENAYQESLRVLRD